MSADNWAVCPKCKQERIERDKKLRKQLASAYGKVSASEYLELEKEFRERVVEDNERDLREDYDIGIFSVDNKDYFEVGYSASCEICGFYFEYGHKEEIKL